MGLRVIALDVGIEKLKYCESLGAEYSVDATNPEAVSQVRKLIDNMIFDHYSKIDEMICDYKVNLKRFSQIIKS